MQNLYVFYIYNYYSIVIVYNRWFKQVDTLISTGAANIIPPRSTVECKKN